MNYDLIWEKLLNVSGYDNSELPQTDNERYQLIHLGIDLYNQKAKKYEGRIQGNITYDDTTETINEQLDSTELLILVYLTASIIAMNKSTEFSEVWGVFAKETGFKDYKAQVESKESKIKYFEEKATQLIEDQIDSFNL